LDDEKNIYTGYLGDAEASPMPERPQRPQTTHLGPGWKLQVKVAGENIVMDIADKMFIGRETDRTEEELALDLGSYGGYQGGVSRVHAVIVRRENGLYIEDLKSTNGTRINGFQLTPNRQYRLRDGDEVEFARMKLVFRFQRPV
jgi:pSer/pThr/pTyr-binding forkhead associated (FHA) protein